MGFNGFGRVRKFAALAALVGLIGTLAIGSPASADEDDPLTPVIVNLSKNATVSVARPADVFSYQFTINCASTIADCVNLVVDDTIPEPFVLDSVALSNAGAEAGTASVTYYPEEANRFTVVFEDELDGGGQGLIAGRIYNFSATVTLPADVSADETGRVITNTAKAELDNRDSRKEATADVALDIPLRLATSVGKAYSETSVPSIPGREVSLDFTAANTSNASVDSLAIEDGTAAAFEYLRTTTAAVTTWPENADRVRTDWFDGTTWHEGTFLSEAALPLDEDVSGLRFVFESSVGEQLPRGASGAVEVGLELRDSVLGITGTAHVDNTASSWVVRSEEPSTPATTTARLDITKAEISPVATKQFSTTNVIGGEEVTVTLGASNGGVFDLSSMSITEPAAGTPGLIEQGLAFTGFDADEIEWPIGAEAASVSYRYAGQTEFAAASSTTTSDTLPGPDPGAGAVDAFIVTFTGLMTRHEFAVVPYTVTTATVDADATSINTIQVDVQTDSGLTASATATDDLTRRTARINTSVRKVLSPGEIYSVRGSSAIVVLPGQLEPFPASAAEAGGSTVGAKSLVITDVEAEFWDYFDLTAVLPTVVPSGVSLEVEYWTGEQWLAFETGSSATGLANYGRILSVDERADVRGIRFTFTPTDPSGVLSPGFAVQPNLRVALRDRLRTDSSVLAADPDATETVTVDNHAIITAFSPSATPTTVEGGADASLGLLPISGGPGGIDLLEKEWTDETVGARTGDEATAVLSWGTGNLEFESVTVSDTEGPATPVAETVFEAFDLVRIAPITASSDPLMTYDEVVGVELYRDGEWVATTSNPCADDACDGTFPGYTLIGDEITETTGVRLVFEESPTRGDRIGNDPQAPIVGSGVAASFGRERDISLVFKVRDVRRSDAAVPVLGSSRSALYNSTDVGVVINTARMVGTAPDGTTRTDTDGDGILILDQALTVKATKSWTGSPLGIPPVNTPATLYPSARMTVTAQNTSAARVDHLDLVEPSARVVSDPLATNPFEFVNITDIVSITVPEGPDLTITLQPSGDTVTLEEALAMTRAELAGVTGFRVAIDGVVASEDTITVVVDTQLRATERTSGAPITAERQLDNEVSASIVDPGGSQVPLEGPLNVVNDWASAFVEIKAYEYGAEVTKTLIANTAASGDDPAIQYEETTLATVRLTAQPTGTVRTTRMVLEDTDARFWNAYDFSGFPALNFAVPIDRVQVDALVGVEYTVDPVDNSISWSCPDTSCWVEGEPGTTLQLPDGVDPSEVRGLRLTFTRDDYAAWERPFNPNQVVNFTVERRELLVAPSGTPVPSTLFTFEEPAPGSGVIGVYSNEVSLVASAAASAEDETPLWFATDEDESSIRFQHLPAKISVEKSQIGAQSLGVDIPYEITVTNTGTAHHSPLTNLEIVDTVQVDNKGPMLVVPTDLDTSGILSPQDAFSYTLRNASGHIVAAPNVTATYNDPDAPSEFTFTMATPLPVGWSLTIHTPLQFRPLLGAAVDTENVVDVTADEPFDECRGTVDTAWGDPTFEVFECGASTTVFPLPSSPMTIIKAVRGVDAGPLDADGNALIDPLTSVPYDDLGVISTSATGVCEEPNTVIPGRDDKFFRYPCAPITRPGAEEEWGARFYNSGNISIKQLVAIDVLPAPGDRGVIIDEARSSKWAARLTTYPELTGMPAGSSYTIYYTDESGVATPDCNAADIQLTMGMTTATEPPILNTPQYRTCLAGDGASLAVPRTWSVLPIDASPELLATVVALKVDARMPTGLEPGDSVGVVYSTRTANQQAIKETNPDNLYRDSIAYNSIAGAAVGINRDAQGNPLDLAYRFVTEPRKVGVALATGQIMLDKTVTGDAASYATDAFDLSLTCLSGDEEVELTLADGTARNPFSITAGTPQAVYGIPLYSTCTVSEQGNYGATTVTGPSAPVPVLAQHSAGLSNVFDPHPAFADRPEVLTAGITNDYPASDLLITKSLETNDAVNQDGEAIEYKAALVSVSCMFDNGAQDLEVWKVTNQAVTPDAPLTKTGLPAGSRCTVTETDQRGATTTSVVTTAAGTVTDDASPGSFVLTEGSNSVAFANDFGVGSLAVTKAFAGLAKDRDWAAGPFTVRVVCTNGNAVTSTVFADDFTISRLSPSFTIENLSTGASCAITEPEKNGATTVALPTNVTVTRSVATATLTNTFNYARLTVSKTVNTTAVDGTGAAVRPGPFSFSVACTFTHGGVTDTVLADGFTVSPMTFSLGHNQNQVLAGLPAGSDCTVTEGTPVGTATTSIRSRTASTDVTTNGLAATITNLTSDTQAGAGTNTAVVTNRYLVGSLEIVKSLQGGASTQFGTGPFEFTVTCTTPGVTAPYVKTVTLPTNGQWRQTISNIVRGSTCSVAETTAGGADTTVLLDTSGLSFDGTKIVIGSALQTVTAQNWYLTGQVTVTKDVTGPGAAFGTGPFTVNLACIRDGKTVTIAGGASRTLVDGASTTYTLLPSGATCTLTETGKYGAGTTTIEDENGVQDVAGAFTFVVDVDAPHDALVDNQPQPDVTVTNNFELAGLVVSKSVDSLAEHEDGSLVTYGEFPAQVSCTFQGSPVKAAGEASSIVNFMLGDGDSEELTGLPAGAVCAVTETSARGAARTVISTVTGNGAPVESTATAASVTLVQDAEGESTNSVAIDNQYDDGSLSLSKSVTGRARAEFGVGTFTVDVECVLGSGVTRQVVWEGSYDFVDGSPARVLSPIAAGAVCTVTEAETAGATSTTVTVGSTTTPGTSAVATVPANATAAVTVTNTFDYASLVVSKTVLSAAQNQDESPVYPGGSFPVEVDCTFLGQTVIANEFTESPMAFSLGHEGSTTLTGLPAGTECAVEETDAVQADSTTIVTTTTDDSATTTGTSASIAYLTSDDDGEPTNSAAITNRYDVTSFTVEKLLEGGAAAQYGVGPFLIDVTCVAPGNVLAFDDTVSLPDGDAWFRTIEDIPSDSVCSIEETNATSAGADAHAVVDADGDAATEVTTTLENPGYLAVVNYYLTGSVEVTKAVTGLGDAYGAGPFEVGIECVRGDEIAELPVDSQSFVDGETVTFTGLPSGASCTVTETDAAGAASTEITLTGQSIAGASDSFTFVVDVDAATLVDDQPQQALTVTNTFPLAGLSVSKAVISEAKYRDDLVEYGPFEVTVDCLFLGEPVWAAGYDDETPMVGAVEAGAAPWMLRGLPTGAECVVEETDAMDADETSVGVDSHGVTNVLPGTSATVILTEDVEDAVTTAIDFTNTFDSGSITLSKSVTGDGDEAWGTATFAVDIDCSLTDASGTRVVLDGTYEFERGDEPIVIDNLPEGAVCAIEETDTGAANETRIFVPTVVTVGTTAELTVSDGNTDVVVQNRFDVTSIDVTKSIVGDGASAWGHNEFRVSLVCTRDVDGETETIEIPEGATRDLLAPDYTASYSGLPVGADCAMSEVLVGGADGSLVSPGTFVLGADATAVTVTNQFDTGALKVTKEMIGDGVDIDEWGTGPFTVELSCTREVNGETVAVEIPLGASRTLAADNEYVATYAGLPARATCSITETVDGEATSTVITPGTIEIVADSTVDVTVTNTFTIGQLKIVKTASSPIIQGADEFTYSFAVSNTGTVPAAGVTVVDEIPAELRVVSVAHDGWSECAVSDTSELGYGGILTCMYDETLPAGASADVFTITVAVLPDISVDDIDNVASVTSTTRGVKGDDDDEAVLVKWLNAVTAAACVLDAPWFTYEVDAHNVDLTDKSLTVTWRDGTGSVVRVDEIPITSDDISGKLLWPGAAVNADGIGIDWPGYREALPGETPTFENLILDPKLPEYGLRDGATVELAINPHTAVSVTYPPQSAECVVEREPGLWLTKTASQSVVPAGGEFDYTIKAGNDGLGAVSNVRLIDEIPAQLTVVSVKPADPVDELQPAWAECEVTDRLASGAGGTLTCLLDRALGYDQVVPDVVLGVRLDSSVAAGTITNLAKIEGTGTDGGVRLEAEGSAVIATPGMLALTGFGVSGLAVLAAVGLLGVGGVLVLRRRRTRADTLGG